MALLRASPRRHFALVPFDRSAAMPSLTRRDLVLDTLAGAAVAGLIVESADADSIAAPGDKLPTGDIHDFDFFVGNWQSTNHRLRKRWVGSNDWETFPCTIRCESR